MKDLLRIAWSVVVSGAVVTPTQYISYAVAFASVMGYTHYKRTMAAAQGLSSATSSAKIAAGDETVAREEHLPLSSNGRSDSHATSPSPTRLSLA